MKTVLVHCANCGKEKLVKKAEFERQTKNNSDKKWFCGSKCFSEYRFNESTLVKICPRCHKKFTCKRHEEKEYCSRECANASREWTLEERIHSSEVHKRVYAETHGNSLKVETRFCVVCGNPLFKKKGDCCSSNCREIKRTRDLVDRIERSGTIPTTTFGETDRRVAKRYLKAKHGEKCAICGKVGCKLFCDHIDGDAMNSNVSNLRLICEECDRKTDTYKNKPHEANRPWRRKKRLQ